MSRIPATIGVLTHNSEANLERCLAGVQEFEEIIIADGGSTDATRSIAERFGARVIPQSNPGHPITDFALERNRLLEAATMPWFFYLDSDEIMSDDLVSFIRAVTASSPCDAYRVRYLKTNADATKIYRTYREYYQIRLTRTDRGTHFERPVHERMVLPASARIGKTDAPWYVPLDADDLRLKTFFAKAWTRTAAQAAAWQPRGTIDGFSRVLWIPLVHTGKSLYKMVAVKLKWGGDAIPFQYEALRILYAWCVGVQSLRRILGLLEEQHERKKERKELGSEARNDEPPKSPGEDAD